jgi:hypothetical protein
MAILVFIILKYNFFNYFVDKMNTKIIQLLGVNEAASSA